MSVPSQMPAQRRAGTAVTVTTGWLDIAAEWPVQAEYYSLHVMTRYPGRRPNQHLDGKTERLRPAEGGVALRATMQATCHSGALFSIIYIRRPADKPSFGEFGISQLRINGTAFPLSQHEAAHDPAMLCYVFGAVIYFQGCTLLTPRDQYSAYRVPVATVAFSID